MSEIEGLKSRVVQAVEQLSSVQDARRDQNQNLTGFLGGLEEKFQARTVELEYCNSQIAALTQDNAQLSELLERLVDLIEDEPSAADTVDGDIMDEPVVADIEIPETEIAAEDDLDDILAGEIEEDTESSIRAMMARLEAAALDAKFPSEDDTAQPDLSEQVA